MKTILSAGISRLSFSLLTLFLPLLLSGQDSLELRKEVITQRDLSDVIRTALNKPPKAVAEKTGSLILLPILGYNPATGFMFGVGGQYAFKFPGNSLYSAIMGSLQFTTKSQMLVLLKNNIYTRNNRFFLSGDWRYMIYSQDTYGLGTNAPEGGLIDYQYSIMGLQAHEDSLAQPMKFNFIRLYQSVSYKLADGFYAGIGYNLDSYFSIRDEKLRLNPGDTLLTSHYTYNTHYGFPTDK
jgi:hypothetical protein